MVAGRPTPYKFHHLKLFGAILSCLFVCCLQPQIAVSGQYAEGECKTRIFIFVKYAWREYFVLISQNPQEDVSRDERCTPAAR
jgi:hypothetical protein